MTNIFETIFLGVDESTYIPKFIKACQENATINSQNVKEMILHFFDIQGLYYIYDQFSLPGSYDCNISEKIRDLLEKVHPYLLKKDTILFAKGEIEKNNYYGMAHKLLPLFRQSNQTKNTVRHSVKIS